jgi:capsular polysaccharide biosynthesis protein
MGSARRYWPVVGALAVGTIAGVLVSFLGSGTHEAQASVLISSPTGGSAVRPMLLNLRELAVSGVVAGNVRSTLRLTEPTEELRRHLDAIVRPKTEVIAITARDAHAERARQLAQEAAAVFAQVVERRFGTGKPELHAAVLDSAHVLGATNRHVDRNSVAGGLIGLLLGAAAMFVLATRSRQALALPADDSDLRNREQLLEQRVKSVAGRERALAARVGKIAARERELEEKVADLVARERDVEVGAREVASSERALAERAKDVAVREKELEAKPDALAPEPAPPETESAPVLAPARAAWNLNDLQKAVDSRTDVPPEQAEDWRTYLFLLRQHATQDGVLPRSFESLIREVFAEVLHVRPLS